MPPERSFGFAGDFRAVFFFAAMRRGIATCLWLDGTVEEAARFYVSLVPESELGPILRKDDGSALVVELSIGGTSYQLLDGGPQFELDEAASIVVHTAGQDETDRYWVALTSDGGRESMCGLPRPRQFVQRIWNSSSSSPSSRSCSIVKTARSGT